MMGIHKYDRGGVWACEVLRAVEPSFSLPPSGFWFEAQAWPAQGINCALLELNDVLGMTD
jgi:hypothetical protein